MLNSCGHIAPKRGLGQVSRHDLRFGFAAKPALAAWTIKDLDGEIQHLTEHLESQPKDWPGWFRCALLFLKRSRKSHDTFDIWKAHSRLAEIVQQAPSDFPKRDKIKRQLGMLKTLEDKLGRSWHKEQHPG